ncbi:MAG: hypothetical protein LLF98_02410 [Clostridium sp.]|uniref:hypothetical protein n=1 Tax=Clostridium sp. TaxID=1506 RepID=UPI0025C68E75|nr:hypothetical protein [Clostridium sp.]MCE5220135.1 hypothetical protein [Clostridium sp.]
MQTLENRIKEVDQMETQRRFLELINNYNSADRKLIKANFKRILKEFNIQPKDIMELGYSSSNTYAWGTTCNKNIPLFNQALHIACEFNFDIQEFLKEI